MTARPLRRAGDAPPVRAVHLGLGSFFRAHQAWYTSAAADAAGWGIAAFPGRRPNLAEALAAQGGLYTLVTRAAEGDRFEIVGSLARAYRPADHATWLTLLASPDVRLLTTTFTEAGYQRTGGGGLDTSGPGVARDIAALRDDPRAPVATAPARIVAGLLARRRADAGPLTLVPCDNLPDNGAALTGVVAELAAAVDRTLPGWIGEQVAVATTMVDRITPEPTPADRATVLAATGVDDRCPVVTEPFTEWVIAGDFPGGRPAWETAGATLTDDVTPFEQRKLWLLNGGHSLLAYVGSLGGSATTVDEAVRDERCRSLLESWWATCAPHLAQAPAEITGYCAALLERFANPRMSHALAQIATDGSQKLPVRLLPVLRRDRSAGRLPDVAVTVLAAWLLYLRGGKPVRDVRAAELQPVATRPLPDAVPGVLAALDPALADDAGLVSAVRARATELSRPG